ACVLPAFADINRRHVNGKAEFQFRTYVAPVSKNETPCSYTDAEGRIFVEGIPLDPGYYRVQVFFDGSECRGSTQEMWIGPLVRDLAFPDCDILAGREIDPYCDEFRLEAFEDYSGTRRAYGLGISYWLNKTVWPALEVEGKDKNIKALMAIANTPADELLDSQISGDMAKGKKHFIYARACSFNRCESKPHLVKLEGYKDTLEAGFEQIENADEIFMDGKEVEHDEEWGPGDSRAEGRQNKRGAAPWDVAAEGRYNLIFGVSLYDDRSQRQMFQIGFSVQYRAHGEFLRD
ncbi:MAG: hypothetical protein N3A66_09565, partial [Planctomycetota bacterium]|nr:hypothetical protein [Planctomycetota bacterium]